MTFEQQVSDALERIIDARQSLADAIAATPATYTRNEWMEMCPSLSWLLVVDTEDLRSSIEKAHSISDLLDLIPNARDRTGWARLQQASKRLQLDRNDENERDIRFQWDLFCRRLEEEKTRVLNLLSNNAAVERELSEFIACSAKRATISHRKRIAESEADLGRLIYSAKVTLMDLHFCLCKALNKRKQIDQENHIRKLQEENKRRAFVLNALQAPFLDAKQLCNLATRHPMSLTERDVELAYSWARFPQSKYELRRMLSARRAERAALELYWDLYGYSKDLSISQLERSGIALWRHADIDCGAYLVDVKNSRESFSSERRSYWSGANSNSSPRFYSEHCVPAFKQDRKGSEVVISGFLSEYEQSPESSYTTVIWLGEFTLSQLASICTEFDSKHLMVSLADRESATLLPPWIFEYPTKAYFNRDVSCEKAMEPRVRDALPIENSNRIAPALLLLGGFESSHIDDSLQTEYNHLMRRLSGPGRLVRSRLFLHVLDRFASNLRNDLPFPAQSLRDLLFWNDSSLPLALYDPLQTVSTLIETLAAVDAACRQETSRFLSLRLRGLNILQGRKPDGSWQTIYAYCGGRLPNKVKCGQYPIFLGRDEPCPKCHHLICSECGFCSKICKPLQQHDLRHEVK